MKTMATRLMIAVAAVAAVATCASAQTYKADIPMAFRVGSTLLAPGSYDFVLNLTYSSNPAVLIRSHNGKQSVMVLPMSTADAPKVWRAGGKPKIAFACAGRNCALTSLYRGTGIGAYQFRTHKLPAAEADRASVTLPLTRVD